VADIRANHSAPTTFREWVDLVGQYDNPTGCHPAMWWEVLWVAYAWELRLMFDSDNNVVGLR
jgi:hypothetical protein